MPKYMIQGSYPQQGVQGIAKEGGSSRVAEVTRLVEALGGKVETFYFSFGTSDFVVIIDVPDNTTALAGVIAAGASTGIDLETTVLITPKELDAAAKKTMPFRAAGQ